MSGESQSVPDVGGESQSVPEKSQSVPEKSQSVPDVVGESQSVPVVGDSFATIIISAHGADLREDRTTPEQHATLRKFTMAGKSGHIAYDARDVIDSMFYFAHQLARLEDVPFTEKLKFMSTELRHKFGGRLQNIYHESQQKDSWRSLVPTADDWLSITNVSYNHEYHFVVNDPADPWEIEDFGIWLVDGSPQVLQDFKKDVPIPPDSLRYYNIMDRIGLPQWPDKRGTVTTLFKVADKIKATYGVKYVNFIDTSCRFVYHPIAATDDVPSAPMSEIAPSTAHQPDIIQIGNIPIRRHAQPPDLPPGWVFGKNLTTGEYVYANPDSGAISPDFPGTSSICVATLEGHREDVASVAFHPTGRLLATGSWDNTTKVWRSWPDNSSWTCVVTLDKRNGGHTDYVTSVAFNSTRLLATGSCDNTAKVWHLSPDGSAHCVATLEGHTAAVRSVAFNSSGILATGSLDKTVKLWNTKGCVATLTGHTDAVTSVAFHPTAAFILATGSYDDTAKLWRLSPNNTSAACVATLEGHDSFVTSVAFNSTGTLLATGSRDNTAKVWQLSSDGTSPTWSATCVMTLEGHISIVSSVAFNSTGTLLATGSGDNTAKLWNASGTCVATLEGHTSAVRSVAFNPTGTLLATGSRDSETKLWNSDELLNKIKQENRAPGAPGYMVTCDNKIDPPKMFGMPQTLPQDWIYVRGKNGKAPHYINVKTQEINPHFPGPYRAGSKKSSKQNKKKTKRSSKNKKKTKKTKKDKKQKIKVLK
jgi:WD40 repeat protein